VSTAYDDRLLEAFVQKPEKMAWYSAGLAKMTQSGFFSFKWHWSWWAFFFGLAYLLYRKAYLPALVVFLISIPVAFIPFGGIVMMIVVGGVAPYYVMKRYVSLKTVIEAAHEDEESRVQAMRNEGGFNTWVIWVLGTIYAILILLFLAGFVGLLMAPDPDEMMMYR